MNEQKQEFLPVENFTSTQAIERGFEKMLYAVTNENVPGESFYPAWQFVDPVPKLLPDIIAITQGDPQSPVQLHAFLVTEEDSLNELSPAEVLAGKYFAGRTPDPCQDRILNYSEEERFTKVKLLAWQVVAESAERERGTRQQSA